ncbi:MAG: FAD-binding oxidoreductase, partial [Aliifodinibius sp.]|nr:FAD-binding oxidoreductase [Fodinibius sp.]NIV12400.1 FAD-binding oxidoreductase [Fodinibius sp.]NIY24792.1 FAD-binding oxidoreductase [Fodinibius sp.]
ISWSERFFGEAAKLYPLASLFPQLSNWIIRQPVTKELLYHFLGIDKRRNLPTFAEETFMNWWKNRPVKARTDGQAVVLLIDIFTNYHEPKVGKAAVQFLESQDYRVIIPNFHEVGRPQISKGMLTHAKEILDTNLPKLTHFADQGISIIGLEPSEILTLRDEYLDLCDEGQVHSAKKVANASYTFEEFAADLLADSPVSATNRKVFVHGHCHAESLIGNTAIRKSLEGA